MKVMVTGASGFVGRALVGRLAVDGNLVSAASRSPIVGLPLGAHYVSMNTLDGDSDPVADPCAAEVVVHTAARVHVMKDTADDPLGQFRKVNVFGSLAIARQMRTAGARRFVYLSSIKVLGEKSVFGKPLDADSTPVPADYYSQSKLEAERALAAFCTDTEMELVIIRPPLVYGPGVKANFERLMRAVAQRQPLPFGLINQNRRSLVAIDNLVDLVVTCVNHPAAPGRAFLVSDGEDLSTAELVRRLSHALGVRPRLLPVPAWALHAITAAIGRGDAARRLCESLQVDIGALRRDLGWVPPITVDEGLARAAEYFLSGTRA